MRALAIALIVVGCSGSSDDSARPACAGSMVADSCVPALAACKADEIVRDGACVRVGVTSCAPGFVADTEGCRPVLPAAPCPEGEVAWLGESSCHPVADCTDDKFGSPPTTAPILYVDVLGDDANDGSREKPFKTIKAALTRARGTKHTVAIADGTYDEELVLNSDVDLWGRCPSKVTIAPTAPTQVYAITIVKAAASIKRLGIAGSAGGIVALDTVQATVEDSWIHDTNDAALGAQGDRAEGSLVAKHVLVERARDFGVYALAGTVTVEASIVRETRSAPGNLRGYGVGAENSLTRKKSGAIVVRGSIVEKNRETNVFAIGSSAIVEGSLLRDARAGKGGAMGVWVTADTSPDMLPTSLKIADSVITGSIRAGVHAVGADVAISNSAITHTARSEATNDGGYCAFLERSTTTASDVLCRDAFEIGIEVSGGAAKLERLAVLDVKANPSGGGGIGIASIGSGTSTPIEVLDTAVARLSDAGMFFGGSEATVRGCAVRDVQQVGTEFGDGIQVAPWTTGVGWTLGHASVSATIVERTARGGIVTFGGMSTSLRDVRVECARLDIVASDRRGAEEVPEGPRAQLVDEGGSYCGCGSVLAPCKGSVSSIAPLQR